jgi:hypothetical protein
MIKLSIEFKQKRQFNKLTQYLKDLGKDGTSSHFILQEEVDELGDKAVETGRAHISASKKRRSLGSNLENTIQKEVLQTVGGVEVGIGNINKLKTDAPYFEVLNDGGYGPYSTAKGAPLGSFEGSKPDSNVVSGNQNWERSGNKGYFMKPKKAIEGINYIGKMVALIQTSLTATVKALGNKILSDSHKHGYGLGSGGAK